jgi:hypothetical protein
MEIEEHELKPIPRQITCNGEKDEIYLTIEIGNGQVGSNKVLVESEVLAKGNLSESTYVASLDELKGKVLEVHTNILDVNAFTNMCVLTTTFFDQDHKVLFSKIDKGEVPEGGLAIFKAKYAFGLLVSLLIILSPLSISNAQSSSESIEFNELATPTSPGFILLDKTPATIEKPTTPQGFGLSIAGFFQGSGGAIEFAPFWLLSHPKLTAEKMYRNRFPILYNLSVSVATINTDVTTFLAGGLRTRLLQIHSKNRVEKLDSVRLELETLLIDPMDNLEAIKVLRDLYVSIINEDIELPIFTIELAAAMGASSLTNSFSDLGINRRAAWLSFNYRPGGDDFYMTVLTRYIKNERFQEYNDNIDLFDIGARANYDISNFCISLEYIQRLNFTESLYADNRLALIGSYRISDSLFLTSTFGKNFTNFNNIIALAGVNFGFSKNKLKAY